MQPILIEFTDRNAGPILWATVEPCTGIVCACLPVLNPIFSASLYQYFIASGSRLRSWLNNTINFSRPCGLRSSTHHAKPQLVASDAKATPTVAVDKGAKGNIKGLFTHFTFSTTAIASRRGSQESFAMAPLSPNINRHTSATYSQAVGRSCGACGGTGIEPPKDTVDLEKGKAQATDEVKVKTEVAEFDGDDGELREMKLTIHDVRRWGRENVCESGIWGHGRINM